MTATPIQFRSVMLTGHRPQALTRDEISWSRKTLHKTIRRLKHFHGIEEVISGMALGADTWWAQSALELNLPLAAYIPFEAQVSSRGWTTQDKETWRELRSKSFREVVLGEEYQVWLLHARNDAMIRDSDLAVALWKQSKQSGGTFSAVKKLRQKQRPLILIDPELRTITTEGMETI